MLLIYFTNFCGDHELGNDGQTYLTDQLINLKSERTKNALVKIQIAGCWNVAYAPVLLEVFACRCVRRRMRVQLVDVVARRTVGGVAVELTRPQRRIGERTGLLLHGGRVTPTAQCIRLRAPFDIQNYEVTSHVTATSKSVYYTPCAVLARF